jgi:hypothetical protein
MASGHHSCTAPNPSTVHAPWRHSHHYAYLKSTGRAGFAWEWLRRTAAYQTAWRDRRTEPPETAHGFGLEAWVDPFLPACRARPIWHAAIDPGVLPVTDARAVDGPTDGLDLLPLAQWLSVAIDRDDNEHWLISDGTWAIRLDVAGATLLGGRFEPRFELAGLARLRRALRALERLRALATAPRMPVALRPDHAKADRWIAELRAADAMANGATTRDIAQALYGIDPAGDWKIDQDSYRSRTRRLMRSVRQRLAPPVIDFWFDH